MPHNLFAKKSNDIHWKILLLAPAVFNLAFMGNILQIS
jgi:hypothetical protein